MDGICSPSTVICPANTRNFRLNSILASLPIQIIASHIRARFPSWLYGNKLQLLTPSSYGDHELVWRKKYGSAYKTKGCFGKDVFFTSDPLTMQYVLNSPSFERSPILRRTGTFLFGEKNVSASRGETHRRLRGTMGPAFTTTAVRNFLPVFQCAARKITETWEAASEEGSLLDICPALTIATLKSASEAVLGCPFEDVEDLLGKSHRQMIQIAASRSKWQIIADDLFMYLPAFVLEVAIRLPTNAFRILRNYGYLANKLGTQLVDSKLEASKHGIDMDNDVYSILLKQSASGRKHTMNEQEIAAQTAIFLIASQDTTENTLAFALYELAKHLKFQEQLRNEILGTTHSTESGYDNVPLLNAFIKETLRLHPIVPLSDQIAVEDTVLPLGTGIVTATGEYITSLPVKKGQLVTLGIASYQRLPSIWGSEAEEFNPARWLEGSAYKGEAFGPYANLLSFLGGPHVCIGLLEMQTIIAEVVSNFSLALPEDSDIRPCYANTLMPVNGQGEKGAPLIIKRLVQT
ncbi:cytochrome P450 [Mycena polygramma]|nr:cytochrome P450 [Mycena polygramma]